MNIYKQYAPIYRDATVLLRPRTPLKDMYLALDPGTKRAGAVPDGGMLSAARDQPRPSTSTRSCLARRRHPQLPAAAALRRRPGVPRPAAAAASGPGPGAAPSQAAVDSLSGIVQALRAAEPRHPRRSPRCSPRATPNMRTAIHNLQLVATALGGVDGQLASLIDASNTNFSAISSQDANLEQALTLLPGTLTQTDTDPGQGAGVRRSARPGAGKLVPFAHALGPGAEGLPAAVPRHHAGDPRTSCGRSRSPCSRWPASLRPAATKLARGHAAAHALGAVLNTLFNTLAYQPEGKRAGLPVLGLVAGPHRRRR